MAWLIPLLLAAFPLPESDVYDTITQAPQAVLGIACPGYRSWGGGDCKAIVKNNASYCDTGDCKGTVKHNASYCDNGDCKACVRNNVTVRGTPC